MDYKAYHQALMLGYSESEATRVGEDAFLDTRSAQVLHEPEYPAPLCDICGAGDAVTTTNGYLVCSEQCDSEAIIKQSKY